MLTGESSSLYHCSTKHINNSKSDDNKNNNRLKREKYKFRNTTVSPPPSTRLMTSDEMTPASDRLCIQMARITRPLIYW